MSNVVIKILKEEYVVLDKHVWESFGERLPEDMEDLDMLHDEAKMWEETLIHSEELEGKSDETN